MLNDVQKIVLVVQSTIVVRYSQVCQSNICEYCCLQVRLQVFALLFHGLKKRVNPLCMRYHRMWLDIVLVMVQRVHVHCFRTSTPSETVTVPYKTFFPRSIIINYIIFLSIWPQTVRISALRFIAHTASFKTLKTENKK